MPYDLYGNYYASAIDAMNAEEAQCAAIDANLAYNESKKQAEIIQRMEYEHGQQIQMLMDKITELEERIKKLENVTN